MDLIAFGEILRGKGEKKMKIKKWLHEMKVWTPRWKKKDYFFEWVKQRSGRCLVQSENNYVIECYISVCTVMVRIGKEA